MSLREALLLLSMVGVLSIGVLSYQQWQNRSTFKRTNGVIVAVADQQLPEEALNAGVNPKTEAVIAAFGGEVLYQVRSDGPFHGHTFSNGDPVEVFYDSSNPNDIVIGPFDQNFANRMLMMVALSGAGFLWLLHQTRLRTRIQL